MSLITLTAFLLVGGRQATPQSALTAFVAAWNSKDLKRAAAMVVGGKPNADYSGITSQATSWPKITVAGIKATTKGDESDLTYKATLSGVGGNPIPPQDETAKLLKVNGKWLIVPAVQNDGNRSYVPSMAALMARPEAFGQARQASKATQCLSNTKQLAVAAIILSADNDDVFKINPAKAKATLHPYVKNDKVWFCPEAPAGRPSYSFNANLSNKSATALADPTKVVMIYEGANGKLEFRHQGRAAVAFADGHAKLIKPEEAKKLVWKP